jgi:two-component system response regulator DevR
MTSTDRPLTTVMLVEDHDLVRQGLTTHVNAQADMTVIGAVATMAEALEQLTILRPDVAVIDVQLPDGNGLVLCQRIHNISPSTRCIIHTSAEINPEDAAQAGAAAVVLKQLVHNELYDAIRTVHRPLTD